jgi:hypothetical protein
MVREEAPGGDGDALTAAARCLVSDADLTRRRDSEEREWTAALVEEAERTITPWGTARIGHFPSPQ